MTLPLIVLLPLGGALLPVWFLRWGRNQSALAAGAVASAALALLLSHAPQVFAGGVVRIGWDWLPAAGLRFSFLLDGLGFLFAFLILGIGLLVILYARHYLAAEDPMGRFYAYLLLFMGAMLGIVLAENLILLVICWELTSLSSFLLIGYWYRRPEGRRGARMALTVTVAGGLALLAGVLLLGSVVGSHELGDVLAAGDLVRASPLYLPILVLVLLGAFTKSAQFPFHFWLPQAMAAPTPVSAYLHSATMVKGGIFLLARLHPALAGTAEWFFLVAGTGMVTLVVAAYVALLRHDLKALLAYSTISHLGLITALLGFGSPMAAVVGLFHVMNHAAFKAALFMNAGIVDHETGRRDLRQLGGLRRTLPLSAALAGLATAAMAGVPPLNGFLSKEMFLEETLHLPWLGELPWLVPALATLGAVLSVGYALSYFAGVYLGPERAFPRTPHEPPFAMNLPVVALVAVCVLVGLLPALVAGPLLAVAAAATLQAPPPDYALGLWHGFTVPLALSALALAGGALAWAGRRRLVRLHEGPLPLPVARSLYERAVGALVAAARGVTEWLENGSLQRYLALLVATAVAAASLPLLRAPVGAGSRALLPAYAVDVVAWLLLVAGTVGTVLLHRRRIIAVIFLSVVGLMMALAFVHLSAPDLALTQLSVEVVGIVLILLALHFLPRAAPSESSWWRIARDGGLALAAGAWATAVAWAMMTRPLDTISSYHVAQSKPGGGGANIVNVILVDFRGFDTLGEITVLAIAALGIYALIDGLGIPRQWVAPTADEEKRHPLLLTVVARLMLPLALLVAVYLFLRGHNLPGGGFIAGLVVGVALILQYIASGVGWAQQRLHRDFHYVIGAGVLLAGLTGLGSWLFGYPFLTSWYDHFHLPVIGEFELASAMLFDLGVLLTVVGAGMLVLVHIGKVTQAEKIRLQPDPEA